MSGDRGRPGRSPTTIGVLIVVLALAAVVVLLADAVLAAIGRMLG